MLTKIYVEAFDEELADQVWDAWDARELNDAAACIAWALMVDRPVYTQERPSGW